MKTISAVKERSQESVAHLVDLGEQQPERVQNLGVTAAAAVTGAVALAAVAKLGIVGALAYPPVALAVGALGGGLMGWRFMKKRHTHEQPPSAVDQAPEADAVAVEADKEL